MGRQRKVLKDQALKTAAFSSNLPARLCLSQRESAIGTPADLEERQPTNISPKQFKSSIQAGYK